MFLFLRFVWNITVLCHVCQKAKSRQFLRTHAINSTVLTLLFSIMVYSGATECLPCTSGGRLNETHCSCFAGSHRVNQTSCNVCGPGTYTPRDNMLECVECVGTVTENNTCLCPGHMDLIDDVCVRRNCTPGQKMVSFSLNYWPRYSTVLSQHISLVITWWNWLERLNHPNLNIINT